MLTRRSFSYMAAALFAALALLALSGCGTAGTGPATSAQPPATSLPLAATADELPAAVQPSSLPPAVSTPFTSTLPVIANRSPVTYFPSIIFDADTAARLDIARRVGVQADGYWTPTPAETQALEDDLPAFLQGPDGQPYPTLLGRLPEYTRQYAGLQSGGRRLILANFFCRDLGIDWRTAYVEILDGGDCFFHVLYDFDRGAFSGLSVNGDA